MESLASQLTIYTNTARAIAPQNRLAAFDSSQTSTDRQTNNFSSDSLRSANSTSASLATSLSSSRDLIEQASTDLSRIGDALDEIDALVEAAENNDLSILQRGQLSAQIEDYLTQIDDIAASSNFDGQDLLNADQTITLQVGTGTSYSNQLDLDLYASSSEDLATGLSSIDVSDDAAVSNARTLVDEAQEALRDREIALAADQGSLSTAQNQNRLSQVAGENILQAQLAASAPGAADDAQARIAENLHAYLGNISTQLASQTVTVGGFSLPEPRPDPFIEQDDAQVYDPTAEEDDVLGTNFGQTNFGPTIGGGNTGQPFGTPAFGGYDSGGNGTSGGSGAERPARQVSVEA
jgi:flagellin